MHFNENVDGYRLLGRYILKRNLRIFGQICWQIVVQMFGKALEKFGKKYSLASRGF